MPSEFTVVIDVRHHFGDDPDHFGPNLLFAGLNKQFQFDCPNIDARDWAVMMFQTRDVDNDRNHFEVNDHLIFGGIPVSAGMNDWNANISLVNPGWLRPADNVLSIGSRGADGSLLHEPDDFMIDNLIVLYKTSSDSLIATSHTPRAGH